MSFKDVQIVECRLFEASTDFHRRFVRYWESRRNGGGFFLSHKYTYVWESFDFLKVKIFSTPLFFHPSEPFDFLKILWGGMEENRGLHWNRPELDFLGFLHNTPLFEVNRVSHCPKVKRSRDGLYYRVDCFRSLAR